MKNSTVQKHSFCGEILYRISPFVIVSVIAVSGWMIYNEGSEIREDMTISSLYSRAELMESKQDYDEALKDYAKIISLDESEENAWHEKGRILNYLHHCDDSLNHFIKYSQLFRDSDRAVEGLEIAKNCEVSNEI